MQYLVIQAVVARLLMVFSTAMIPPLLIALWYAEPAWAAFVIAFAVAFANGLLLWLPVRRVRRDLRLRDGFLVVVLFWGVLSGFGAVPFLVSAAPDMSLTEAVFESVSGLTTTGATVLTGLDALPRSVLWYRQQLQWLGGIGIIVLAVAIMPMLGVGGMQLYRAETPGPLKDNKLTPRIRETAKALSLVYLGLTVACALAYRAAGMDGFDAITHSFSTVAIGGFSTHDANMGHFLDRPLVEAVAIVFMLLAGINFALHFLAWRQFSLRHYIADAEVRTYFTVLGTTALVVGGYLAYVETFESGRDTLLQSLFHVVSIGTTTGFTTHAYWAWPGFVPIMLLFTSFIGACAGSTGGGIKVIRFLLLLKQSRRELMRLIHPSAVFTIKVGGRSLPNPVIDAVWGFFAAYVAIFVVMLLLLMLTGLDEVSAFSAVAATLNNLGPGLGEVGPHFGRVSDAGKWLLILTMLLGRLEIFTLLVLLTPAFWRR